MQISLARTADSYVSGVAVRTYVRCRVYARDRRCQRIRGAPAAAARRGSGGSQRSHALGLLFEQEVAGCGRSCSTRALREVLPQQRASVHDGRMRSSCRPEDEHRLSDPSVSRSAWSLRASCRILQRPSRLPWMRAGRAYSANTSGSPSTCRRRSCGRSRRADGAGDSREERLEHPARQRYAARRQAVAGDARDEDRASRSRSGPSRRRASRHFAAHRVTDESGAVDAEGVHEREHESRLRRERVVGVWRDAREYPKP